MTFWTMRPEIRVLATDEISFHLAAVLLGEPRPVGMPGVISIHGLDKPLPERAAFGGVKQRHQVHHVALGGSRMQQRGDVGETRPERQEG